MLEAATCAVYQKRRAMWPGRLQACTMHTTGNRPCVLMHAESLGESSSPGTLQPYASKEYVSQMASTDTDSSILNRNAVNPLSDQETHTTHTAESVDAVSADSAACSLSHTKHSQRAAGCVSGGCNSHTVSDNNMWITVLTCMHAST